MKFSVPSYLLAASLLVSCDGSNGKATMGVSDEPDQVPVWKSDSVKAELYLPSYGELENGLVQSPQIPTPIATIDVETATPEQVSQLKSLKVEKPFEYSVVICDIPAGYEVFYLVITDQNGSIRRFSQYSGCGFSRGEGFFKIEAEGFISDQQICDFGLSFGYEGYNCTER